MFKYLFSCCVAVVFFLGGKSVNAQETIDFIYLLNGEQIEARVESIDGKFVEYKAYGQESTPALRVLKKEVDRVKMANGTEIWFNALPKSAEPEKEAEATPPADKKKKKRNPISAQKLVRQM
ncbi:MAG: hypothetical protein KDC66_11935 [Phaeodactylibacter sp.]|nr:hypothetical protein [Phaeodactylibacter sp.]MCB9273338.1 hypothetical protein [Lewinellaceae bacterium]